MSRPESNEGSARDNSGEPGSGRMGIGSRDLDPAGSPDIPARLARSIPPGSVRSYGDIARAIGRPRAARAVGQAMGQNPVPVIVPCHRVVATSGPGGFSAAGGLSLKRKMLLLEGATDARMPGEPAGRH